MTPEDRAKRALEIQEGLLNFTGTEQWDRHPLMRNVLLTDGARYVADNAAAYWLIDKIATLQMDAKIKAEPFQVWRLVVTNETGTLTATDGGKSENDGFEVLLHSEHITYTDFPLDQITLLVERDDDQAVILLPSEH